MKLREKTMEMLNPTGGELTHLLDRYAHDERIPVNERIDMLIFLSGYTMGMKALLERAKSEAKVAKLGG